MIATWARGSPVQVRSTGRRSASSRSDAVADGAPGGGDAGGARRPGLRSTVAVMRHRTGPSRDRPGARPRSPSGSRPTESTTCFSVDRGPRAYTSPSPPRDYHPTVVDRSLGSSVVASADTALLDGELGSAAQPAARGLGRLEDRSTVIVLVLRRPPQAPGGVRPAGTRPEEMGDGLPNWYITISGACNHAMLFEQLARSPAPTSPTTRSERRSTSSARRALRLREGQLPQR